jgi:H/ACA ribonucleoprotein complex subunit 4
LTPVESKLTKIPSITIKDGAVAAMTHGAPLARPGLVDASSGILSGSLVVIRSMKGEAVAVAETSVNVDEVLNTTKGQIAAAKSVLMPTGIYPQNWSKQN